MNLELKAQPQEYSGMISDRYGDVTIRVVANDAIAVHLYQSGVEIRMTANGLKQLVESLTNKGLIARDEYLAKARLG